RRFQHEGSEGFITEKRSLDRSGAFRQYAPVGAELESHDDSTDHAHAERQGKYLEPEVEDPPVEFVAGPQPHAFESCKPCGEPNSEGWEDDMKADHERELQPRQEYRIELHDQTPHWLARQSAPPSAASVAFDAQDSDLRSPDFDRRRGGNI